MKSSSVHTDRPPYRPLFLLGLMRSGTTYFRNVLSDNQCIQAMGSEMNSFWTEVGKAPSGIVEQNPYMIREDAVDSIVETVNRHYNSRYHRRNYPNRLLFRTYRKIKNGNETIVKCGQPYYLLNKSTHLINKIGYLNRVFPKARYVVLIRDINSQSCSLYSHLEKLRKNGYMINFEDDPKMGISFKKGEQSEPVNFEQVVRFWVNQNSLMLHELETFCQGQYILIDYKDIVTKIDEVLKRLGDFLDIKMNPHVEQKVINNYSKNPLTDWREKLSEEQISQIRRVETEMAQKISSINKHLTGV